MIVILYHVDVSLTCVFSRVIRQDVLNKVKPKT